MNGVPPSNKASGLAAPPPIAAPLLTESQLDAFRRDGFISMSSLADPQELASLAATCDQLFARQQDFKEGDRIELNRADGQQSLPQIVNPERYAPQLVQGQTWRNAQAIARQLLGADFKSTGNHAILKAARIGAETPWHQDEAYWDPRYKHEAISIWLALQPATVENGCMQFATGSHRGPVLPHELVDRASHGLRLGKAATAPKGTPCELPAGGACIHAGRTLHYAGPNRTDSPRRALIFGFGLEPVLLDKPNHYSWQRPEWFAAGS
jgi:ectoine hydroxylase-related dioxygenase (phytanoyl-CoA dioxygenase family)